MEQLEKKVKEDNKYKEKITQDLNNKIMILKTFLENFDFSIIRKMTIINTHGDFSVQQLIYNDKKGTTVIDFETAKKMPIVWEVIRSYSYIDKDAKNGEFNIDTLVEYFKEFDKYIKLNKYDLKYAPHIYLLQLAGSTFGYKEYIDDYKQKELLKFGLFRTNLCKFLYENLDEISLKLKNEIKRY